MATPLTPTAGSARSAEPGTRTATGLTLIIGIWFIFAPWILAEAGVASTGGVWDNVVVGILIAAFAGAQLRNRGPILVARWCDAILGVWAFFSPWIFGYTASTRLYVDSLCVGVAIFLLSLWGMQMQRRAAPSQ